MPIGEANVTFPFNYDCIFCPIQSIKFSCMSLLSHLHPPFPFLFVAVFIDDDDNDDDDNDNHDNGNNLGLKLRLIFLNLIHFSIN